jgi:hypothetical protein
MPEQYLEPANEQAIPHDIENERQCENRHRGVNHVKGSEAGEEIMLFNPQAVDEGGVIPFGSHLKFVLPQERGGMPVTQPLRHRQDK